MKNRLKIVLLKSNIYFYSNFDILLFLLWLLLSSLPINEGCYVLTDYILCNKGVLLLMMLYCYCSFVESNFYTLLKLFLAYLTITFSVFMF